jgi:hypothetical protein
VNLHIGTPEERAAAAQAIHEHAWRMQRRADVEGRPAEAARWRRIANDCLSDLEAIVGQQRILQPITPEIQKGNSDLVPTGHAYLR